MKYVLGAAAVLAVVTAGCTQRTHLVPAPTARTVAGEGETAFAQAAGVRIEADGKAWSGDPANLPSAIAPVRITIVNNSGRPLRIRYRDFGLSTDSGFTSTALPPLKITGSVPSEPVAVAAPAYGWYGYGYRLAPYYSPWYPGFGVWGGPFAWDFPYYTTYYAQWPVSLPTGDMIRKAIPEGVLGSGGRVEGFVYFPQAPEGADRVTITAELVNAETGERFGKLAIPFEVKR